MTNKQQHYFELYEPTRLRRWKRPDNYIGASWPNHYSAGVGRSRDSDCLEESNFAAMRAALGGESDIVTVVRESHWAVGWVEWIAIEADGTEESNRALRVADEQNERLEDYPVLDEEDFSRREMESADAVWRWYSVADRIQYIRDNPSQFDFRDYRDMIGCVRGNYFAGCASELIG